MAFGRWKSIRPRCVGLLTAALTLVGSWQPVSAAEAPRPNIIVIMADDMGYSDMGCFGSEIATPNLDRLAGGGLRYTNFYNTGRCCPTRASLLTGLYAHQAGIGEMTNDKGQPGYRGSLSSSAVTIAEVLKTTGYKTYMSGKWHVTTQLKPDGDKSNWPLQRGFDRFYGTIIGAGSFYDPWTLTRGNEAITPENDPEYRPQQYYYTHAISDQAVRFSEEHAKQSKGDPFFLYVAYTSPHWPLHALEEDIAKYKGKYDEGYGPIRNARYRKMKELGIIKDEWGLSGAEGAWENVPEDRRAWEARCMEVYAAMITSMDRGIGELVDSLKANGQLDNTLIFFLQDNGGCHETYGRSASKKNVQPTEPMGKDELQTRMNPLHTRAGEPVQFGPNAMPGPANTYLAYGVNWANVSNTPFRLYKSMTHEGGIATPLIAHWPKGITAGNELRKNTGHLIDLMATCVELSGAEYPKEFQGHEIRPMEGVSLVPSFGKNVKIAPERIILWEHMTNAAIRQGKWKLVKASSGPWELYDMEKDRSELHDLVEKNPEKAKELEVLWEKNAHRTQIYPRPDKRK